MISLSRQKVGIKNTLLLCILHNHVCLSGNKLKKTFTIMEGAKMMGEVLKISGGVK